MWKSLFYLGNAGVLFPNRQKIKAQLSTTSDVSWFVKPLSYSMNIAYIVGAVWIQIL